jgi:hypothetical protein
MKINRHFDSVIPAFALAVLVAMTGAVAPLAKAEPGTDLGPLLNGVEQQCQYNDMLERFWRGLSDPERATMALAPKLRDAAGPIQVSDEVDFRMFSIPLRGVWHQVPVRQIQFGLGKGNGIHVLLVEFDAPAKEVRKVFSALVKRSQQAMAMDPDNTLDATTELVIEEDAARLICDLST